MATKNAWNEQVTDANVTFTGGTMSIGTDATDNAINIATSANAGRACSLGNTTGTSSLSLSAGTGGVSITTAANADITLTPGGTGTVSVTGAPVVPTTDRADSLGSATNSWDNVYADGLTFDDGTNILGNYINRTAWTPQLKFGGGTTGITYFERSGYYSRIGNVTALTMLFTLTSKGTSTGAATVTGFPLSTSISTPLTLKVVNVTFATQSWARLIGSTIFFEETDGSTGTTSSLVNTNFANNSSIIVAGIIINL